MGENIGKKLTIDHEHIGKLKQQQQHHWRQQHQ